MKKYIFSIALTIPLVFSAQSDVKKSLKHIKKMGLTQDNLVFTDEQVSLYPRGFIYKINEPDSVFYFGCFSSDVRDVKAYFNDEKTSLSKLPSNSNMKRGGGKYMEEFTLEPLQDKIAHFSIQSDKEFSMPKAADYVVLYYWNNDIVDRDFYNNFKAINVFVKENSEKNILFLAVSTDN